MISNNSLALVEVNAFGVRSCYHVRSLKLRLKKILQFILFSRA